VKKFELWLARKSGSEGLGEVVERREWFCGVEDVVV
jgi:hypothetical protein